jgi:aminoglycoside 6'-N-acetyltransferase
VFRRPIGSAAVVGLGLVVVGLVLLVDPAVRISWPGLLLAFGSSVTAVFLFLGMDEALHALRPTTAAGVVVAAAALVAVPVGLISGGAAVVVRHPSVIGWSILLGLIASGVGLGLLAVGVGSLGALRAAVVAATEPVVAAAMAWVFLGETLGTVQIVGGLIVIGGTAAVARSRARPADRYAVQSMDVDTGFRPIVTERLLLRRSVPADAATISAYRSDPEVHRYQGWDRLDVEGIREQIEEMAARRPGDPGWIQLSMELLDTGELIGDVGLSPAEGEPGVIKVGYTVAPAFQARGYATEAVRALVDYAFRVLGATIVRAYADADNVASHRVAERVGMTLVERMEHRDGEHVWRGVRYEVRA